MRTALQATIVKPGEKCKRIQEMVNKLMNQKALKSWDLNIDQAPIKMTTSVLSTPSLLV
jgi:methionine aminopeptidase